MKFTGKFRGAVLKGDDKPSWQITIAVPRKNIQNANDLAGLQGQAVNVEMMAVQVKMPLKEEDSGELFFGNKQSKVATDGSLVDYETRIIQLKTSCMAGITMFLAKSPEGLFHYGVRVSFSRDGTDGIAKSEKWLPTTKKKGFKAASQAVNAALEFSTSFFVAIASDLKRTAAERTRVNTILDKLAEVGKAKPNPWVSLKAPTPKSKEKPAKKAAGAK